MHNLCILDMECMWYMYNWVVQLTENPIILSPVPTDDEEHSEYLFEADKQPVSFSDSY